MANSEDDPKGVAILAAAAAIEAIRTSVAVDTTISTQVRQMLRDLVNTDGVADPAARICAALSLLAEGMDPKIADGALDELLDFVAPGSSDIALHIARAVRFGALSALAEALARRTFGDRMEGVRMRALFGDRIDTALQDAQGADNRDIYLALVDMGGRIADWISRIITTLAPVILIEAPRSMPSLWWSNRLYGTPSRSGEIVSRNRIPHPSFIPRQFEALAR